MRWSTDDYDSMGWHDVHVHALRIEEGEHGGGELVLDVDYILEWYNDKPSITFRIAPAILRFHQISGLRIALDYATPGAAVCPFSLDDITREIVALPQGCQWFRWRLAINWPQGEITFDGAGFTLELVGPEVTGSRQWLLPEERRGAGI